MGFHTAHINTSVPAIVYNGSPFRLDFEVANPPADFQWSAEKAVQYGAVTSIQGLDKDKTYYLRRKMTWITEGQHVSTDMTVRPYKYPCMTQWNNSTSSHLESGLSIRTYVGDIFKEYSDMNGQLIGRKDSWSLFQNDENTIEWSGTTALLPFSARNGYKYIQVYSGSTDLMHEDHWIINGDSQTASPVIHSVIWLHVTGTDIYVFNASNTYKTNFTTEFEIEEITTV